MRCTHLRWRHSVIIQSIMLVGCLSGMAAMSSSCNWIPRRRKRARVQEALPPKCVLLSRTTSALARSRCWGDKPSRQVFVCLTSVRTRRQAFRSCGLRVIPRQDHASRRRHQSASCPLHSQLVAFGSLKYVAARSEEADKAWLSPTVAPQKGALSAWSKWWGGSAGSRKNNGNRNSRVEKSREAPARFDR
ncbi:hypothetical protein SAMN05216525_15223 [Bradyrhizobium sp. Gha]|nr:hypothetical protein SAMN05216525_15223 [Bradyrhizobium sp. Gha]